MDLLPGNPGLGHGMLAGKHDGDVRSDVVDDQPTSHDNTDPYIRVQRRDDGHEKRARQA